MQSLGKVLRWIGRVFRLLHKRAMSFLTMVNVLPSIQSVFPSKKLRIRLELSWPYLVNHQRGPSWWLPPPIPPLRLSGTGGVPRRPQLWPSRWPLRPAGPGLDPPTRLGSETGIRPRTCPTLRDAPLLRPTRCPHTSPGNSRSADQPTKQWSTTRRPLPLSLSACRYCQMPTHYP